MSKGKYGNPFTATFNGILQVFQKKRPVGELKDTDRIDGKTCLVTGANSGLGFAIATQLAQRGGHVIMACRSGIPEAGEEVKRLSGSGKVEMMRIDLADFESVDLFTKELKNKGVQLDVAIFNAAVVPSGSRMTKDGFEEMFQVNYLAKFVLINRLLKDNTIRNTVFSGEKPASAITSRIIFVSSESHRANQQINFEKLGVFENYKMSQVVALYGYYKLLMTTFANELAERLSPGGVPEVSVHALCPGPVNSNIAREAPSMFRPVMRFIFKLFFADPEKAAEPVLYLAVSPDMEGQTGRYLHLMNAKEMDPKARDKTNRKKLWVKSEILASDQILQVVKAGP